MRKRKSIIIGMVLIAVLAVIFYTRKQSKSVTYTEEAVKRGDLVVSILASGSVLPENRLEIKAPIAGRVEKVLVDEGQRIRKGQILAWMSSTERAALLDAARGKGAEEVKQWEELYRPTPVIAPINGTIILRNVEPGQTFTNTEAILVMSDRLTVKAQVDETDIGKIKLKQKAEIVLDAYGNEKISATVSQIAFEAKTVNNVTNYLVDVLPENTPDYMRSGMTANVTFVTASTQNVLLVPNSALKSENGKLVVLIRNEDGDPVPKPIETGLSDGKYSEVLSGVNEGDIALTPEFVLQDGETEASPFAPKMPGRPRGRR